MAKVVYVVRGNKSDETIIMELVEKGVVSHYVTPMGQWIFARYGTNKAKLKKYLAKELIK